MSSFLNNFSLILSPKWKKSHAEHESVSVLALDFSSLGSFVARDFLNPSSFVQVQEQEWKMWKFCYLFFFSSFPHPHLFFLCLGLYVFDFFGLVLIWFWYFACKIFERLVERFHIELTCLNIICICMHTV